MAPASASPAVARNMTTLFVASLSDADDSVSSFP
jgi:hypothetical protein